MLRATDLAVARSNLKVLYLLLPRIDEFITEVDETPYAYYF
jgi:hypothetical protein